ncbi:MAG: hypothetical protein WC277_07130 [Bacilli bacterium]
MEDRVPLTTEQAIAMLPDGDTIHTFRNSIPGVLLGADWERADVLDAIDKATTREIGGPACCAMKHGLVVWTGDSPLFVECREDVDYDAEITEDNPMATHAKGTRHDS